MLFVTQRFAGELTAQMVAETLLALGYTADNFVQIWLGHEILQTSSTCAGETFLAFLEQHAYTTVGQVLVLPRMPKKRSVLGQPAVVILAEFPDVSAKMPCNIWIQSYVHTEPDSQPQYSFQVMLASERDVNQYLSVLRAMFIAKE